MLTCTRLGKTLVWKRAAATATTPAARPATTNAAAAATACSPTEPPRLRGIGVALGPHNAAMATAGAFRFTKNRLEQKRVFMDFGYVIANAQNGPKANPQRTDRATSGRP